MCSMLLSRKLILSLGVLLAIQASASSQVQSTITPLPAFDADPNLLYCVKLVDKNCKDIHNDTIPSYCQGGQVCENDENPADPEWPKKCPGPQEEVRTHKDYLAGKPVVIEAPQGTEGRNRKLKKFVCAAKLPCKCHYDYHANNGNGEFICVLDIEINPIPLKSHMIALPMGSNPLPAEGTTCTISGSSGGGPIGNP